MIRKMSRQWRHILIRCFYLSITIFALMASLPAESEATHGHHYSGHHYYCSPSHHGFHGHGFHGHPYPYRHFPDDPRISDEPSKQGIANVDSLSDSSPFGAFGRAIGGLVRVITFGRIKFPSASNSAALETKQESVKTAHPVQVENAMQDKEIRFVEEENSK